MCHVTIIISTYVLKYINNLLKSLNRPVYNDKNKKKYILLLSFTLYFILKYKQMYEKKHVKIKTAAVSQIIGHLNTLSGQHCKDLTYLNVISM